MNLPTNTDAVISLCDRAAPCALTSDELTQAVGRLGRAATAAEMLGAF